MMHIKIDYTFNETILIPPAAKCKYAYKTKHK